MKKKDTEEDKTFEMLLDEFMKSFDITTDDADEQTAPQPEDADDDDFEDFEIDDPDEFLPDPDALDDEEDDEDEDLDDEDEDSEVDADGVATICADGCEYRVPLMAHHTIYEANDATLVLFGKKVGEDVPYYDPAKPEVKFSIYVCDDDLPDGIRYHIFRKGCPEPIASYDNYEHHYLLLCQDEALGQKLTPGEYFLAIDNAKFDDDSIEPFGPICRLPFSVFDKGEDMAPLALSRWRMAYSLTRLYLHFDTDQPVGGERVIEALCFDEGSMCYVGIGRCVEHQACKRHCISIDANAWVDGDYMVLIMVNGLPASQLRFAIKGGHVRRVGDVEYIAPHTPMYVLAKEMQRGDSMRNLMECTHGRSLKLHAIDMLTRQQVWSERPGTAYGKMPANMRRMVACEPTKENTYAIRRMVEAMLEPSAITTDCAALAADRDPNAANVIPSMIESMSNDGCYLLTGAGALANPRLSFIVRHICQQIETGFARYCLLVDTAAQLDALRDACPQLMRYFDAQPLTVDAPTASDVVRGMSRWATEHLLMCGPETVQAMAAEVAKCRIDNSWDRVRIDELMTEHVVPRYTEHNLQRMQQGLGVLQSLTPADIVLPVDTDDDGYEQCMAELDALVGLDSLKSDLRLRFKQLRFETMRRKAGLPSRGSGACHTILTGNPGTGKTTVARLMGRIYRALGIISKGDVIVAERQRIVGRYIGETEANMAAILAEAQGNVLFIDEAYTLASSGEEKNDFGRKALDCLLTTLAKPNPDMVVILAGYEQEMKTMLAVNPGMESRFPIRFDFPDYTSSELRQIAVNMLSQWAYEVEPKALEALGAVIERAVAKRDRKFGNARWVEQLVNHRLLPAMAERVMGLERPSQRDLCLVTVADVAKAARSLTTLSTPVRPRLGFCA